MKIKTLIPIITFIITAIFANNALAAPKQTTIAKIVAPTTAYKQADKKSRKVAKLKTDAPLYGDAQQLMVTKEKTVDGVHWYQVQINKRPNNSLGWVSEDSVLVFKTSWFIEINLKKRILYVYSKGKLRKRAKVVVGKASTPTPKGTYAVHEIVPQPKGSSIGPVVLSLTAYSNVLKQFGGGPGQVGIHGRSGSLLRDPLGSARSHGCIRLSNSDVKWISQKVPAGTTVRIK